MISLPGDGPHFRPGDFVRVMDGYFAGYKGTVESVDCETDKVTVLIKIVGRPNPIEMTPDLLTKTDNSDPDPGSPQAYGTP